LGARVSDPTSGFNPSRLYFAAGIEEEEQDLFGSIQPVPEPATGSLLILSSDLLVARRRFIMH
jgi:hypothetical protein